MSRREANMTNRISTKTDDGSRSVAGGPMRRGRWTISASLAVALFTGAVPGDAQAKWSAHPAPGQRVVVNAASKSAVPPELALAVARTGRDQRLTGAGAPGALGVMQVLPAVVRAEFGLHGHDLAATRANAGVGVALLERLYRRYGERWDLALSHYRGGPLPRCEGVLVAHAHTVDYVASVMEWWRRYQKQGTVAALTGGAGNAVGSDTAAGRRFHSGDRPAVGGGRPLRFF